MSPKIVKIFLAVFLVLSVGIVSITAIQSLVKSLAGTPEPVSPPITLKTQNIAGNKRKSVRFDISPDRRYVYYVTADALTDTDLETQYSIYVYDTASGKSSLLNTHKVNKENDTYIESFTDGNSYFIDGKQMLVLRDGKILRTYPSERTEYRYVDYNDKNENICREYVDKATTIQEFGIRIHKRRPLYLFHFPDGTGVYANRFLCTSDYPEKRPPSYAELQSSIASKRISWDYVFDFADEYADADSIIGPNGKVDLTVELKQYGFCFDICPLVRWVRLNEKFIKFYDTVEPSSSNSYLGADGRAYMIVDGELLAVY